VVLFIYLLFIISLIHEVQKKKERQKDRTASTQIMDKNMHVTESKNIR